MLTDGIKSLQSQLAALKLENEKLVELVGIAEIKHSKQQHRFGCGPACLAMLTGIPYARIVEDFGGDKGFDETTRGITHHDCDGWLAEHGYATSRFWKFRHGNKPRDPWPMPPWTDTHLVMVEITGGTHFVVLLKDGTVLDPNQEKSTTLSDPTYLSVCQMAGVHKTALRAEIERVKGGK